MTKRRDVEMNYVTGDVIKVDVDGNGNIIG